jgi:sugar phosphate isomerase/epimerase
MLRRTFFQQSSILAAGALASPSLFAQKDKMPLVGLQLYSVRNEMTQSPVGTLKLLAEMGYRFVEHANYVGHKFYGYSPAEFKKVLADLGLQMPTGHTVLAARHWDADKKMLTDEWKRTIEDAAFMGQEIVITPSMERSVRDSYDSFMQFLEVFNKSADLCKQAGMLFGYHNHDFEFKEKLNGVPLYDLMLQNTNPDVVKQQMDTGNMFAGGASAVDYLTKYPGRFYSFHVKDVVKPAMANGPYNSCIIGQGDAPTQEALKLGMQQGTIRHFIIEQEQYETCLPMDCMKQNLTVIKQWGYG